MSSLPLNVRLDRVAQHILRARIFLDLWSYFEEQQTRAAIISTMRAYGEFFRFTPHAYLMSYVIYIWGVFERRRDTINLRSLIEEIAATGVLQPTDTAKIEALWEKSAPIAAKLRLLRHEAFAHRSRKTSYNDTFKRAAVTANELRELTDVALEIANELLLVRGLEPQFFNPLPRQSAEELMQTLADSDR